MIALAGVPASIAPQVVLGYCDLDGSSLRALEALTASPGHTATHHALQLTGLEGNLKPAFVSHSGAASPCSCSASLTNIGPEGGASKVTLIAINTALPEARQAQVTAAVIELFASTQLLLAGTPQQGEACLCVLASTLLQRSKLKGAHVLVTPGAAGPSPLAAQLASALPPLPAQTQLQDNTLALLHHMALATGTHAAFILTPGYRPTAGSAAESESREGAAVLVGALLAALLGAGVPASGAVVADHGRAGELCLQNPWFSHESARSDGMYC